MMWHHSPYKRWWDGNANDKVIETRIWKTDDSETHWQRKSDIDYQIKPVANEFGIEI